VQLRKLLDEVGYQEENLSDVPLSCEFPDGSRGRFLLNARRLQNTPCEAEGTIILSLSEIPAEQKS
jgi:hypothetical protein